MKILRGIWKRRRWIRSLPYTIFFNFYYLPLKQAFKLPILLYKPKLLSVKGSIIIEAKSIRTGMIKLGFPTVSIYPNSGIIYENHGGVCVFKGRCSIGNSSAISIGSKGNLTLGECFSATASVKLISYNHLEFLENATIGWDNIFTDTDFHKMTKIEGGYTKGFGKILIGKNNWFGLRCITLKNTRTPDFCTVAGNSVLNKEYNFSPYCIIGGNPCDKKSEGFYLNKFDDKIDYEL
jgi:acetyltransferase-like isoleucine patch superfamily enzyme